MGRARAQSSELHFTFQSRVTLAQRTQGIRFIYKILKSQLIIYTVPPHPAIIYTCTSLEKIKTFFKKEKNDYRVGVSMFYPLSASPAGMAFWSVGASVLSPGRGRLQTQMQGLRRCEAPVRAGWRPERTCRLLVGLKRATRQRAGGSLGSYTPSTATIVAGRGLHTYWLK